VAVLTAIRLARRAAAGAARLDELPAAAAQPSRLWLAVPARVLILVGERERRLYVLRSDDLEYVESHGNYVKLHGGGVEYISRDSVKRLAAALAASGFLRIARPLLVNIRSIHYAQRASRGSYDFTLRSGAVVRSGSAFRDEILNLLPLTQTRRGAPLLPDTRPRLREPALHLKPDL
jgi:two-component system, LytTR family, response regulator